MDPAFDLPEFEDKPASRTIKETLRLIVSPPPKLRGIAISDAATYCTKPYSPGFFSASALSLKEPSSDSYNADQPTFEDSQDLSRCIGVLLEYIIEENYFDNWMCNYPDTVFCFTKDDGTPFKPMDFITQLMRAMRGGIEIESTYIIMLIYLDYYLQHNNKDWLHPRNINKLIFCSALLANKFIEDTPVDYLELAKYVGLELAALSVLEMSFLRGLRCELFVSMETYNAYRSLLYSYKGLREIKTETALGNELYL